jgi:hypothetical protein
MPSVQRAHDEYKKAGVPVIAVSVDGDGESDTLPTPLDPDMGVARAMGVRVTPWTVIVDRSGNVVAGGYGKIDMQSAEFRNFVKALSAKPPG